MRRTASNYLFLLKQIHAAVPGRILIELIMNLSAGVLNAWIQVWFIYGIFSALEQGSTPRILIGRLLLFLCICLLQRALYSVWSELLLPSSNVRLYEFFDHRIYDKACRLPFRRLEDPAFYDLYARTREFVDRDLIKAWSNISALSGFIGSVLVSSSSDIYLRPDRIIPPDSFEYI